ncbi:hypothetical protein IP83_15655 [Novosphingobium sp. AAP93]|nr:hypothetical protein IP83_15655 [Novosphingobium sp. AAP93]
MLPSRVITAQCCLDLCNVIANACLAPEMTTIQPRFAICRVHSYDGIIVLFGRFQLTKKASRRRAIETHADQVRLACKHAVEKAVG